jgi:hypothetical protein
MKRSVLVFCLSLSFGNPAFAEKIRTVEGVGKDDGYFERDDEWSLHYTKNTAKREADAQALEKCSKLAGKPLVDLASYTSTCKVAPGYGSKDSPEIAARSYWHNCTVTVLLDCVVGK